MNFSKLQKLLNKNNSSENNDEKEKSRNKELADQAKKQGYPIIAKEYSTGTFVPYSNESVADEEKRLYEEYINKKQKGKK